MQRPWLTIGIIALAFGLGAATTSRADSGPSFAASSIDAIARSLDKIANDVHDLARGAQRDTKTVCECRCGS